MKVLIVHRVNKDKASVKGIYQKLAGIREGFKSNGWQADEICPGTDGIYFNGILTSENGLFGEDQVFREATKLGDLETYDWIYLRFAPLSFWLYRSLMHLKKRCPNVTIIMEFANYPFEYELPFIKKTIFRLLFKPRLHYLKELVDYALHLGAETSVLGIPAIRFDNGFDAKSVRPKHDKALNANVNLLYVGALWPWQGLEELILKIREESQKSDVGWKLTIVGDGPHKKTLEEFIRSKNMQDTVEMMAPAHGPALDEIFDVAHFGVGTLQNTQRKLPYAANLKHRHYAARGLPFFCDVPDPGFSTCEKGYFQFKTGNVNLKDLVDWLKASSEKDLADTSAYLVQFAANHFDWKAIIGNVIENVNSQH